ncbi:MAG: SDR family oxidoreductase [Eubacterium sp.]|nr:SDR family oxidoreductase [Eubacterium sp.]
MRGLKGKVAIVTGGSRGIGKAIARRLLEEDVKVLFCGRNAETGKATLAEFKKDFDNVSFMAGDMESRQFAHDLVATALDTYGQLDYVANNAFPFTAKWKDTTEEEWIHTWLAGPVGYANMITEFVDQRGFGKGAIVCTSSISGHIAQTHRWTYNMAKGAVKQLIRNAALDLSPDIRVNCYSPAWVETDEVLKATPDGTWESTPQAWKEYHMNLRLQKPEEMAAVAAFLLSDDASAITGADIDATSGYLAMGPEGLGKTANFAGSD